jgi:PAS domain S-box-containing protein
MKNAETTGRESLPEGELRRKAEDRLGKAESPAQEAVAEADARALVHELQVHQIELEMQNEELQRARQAAQEASEKYGNLFDFAPVAYFLWDHEARIAEVNLAGAALLGLDRRDVIQKRFGQFLARTSRPAFADFCKLALTTGARQTCEVKLLRAGGTVHALVEAIAANDSGDAGRFCRAAVIDISQQKRADELADAVKALKAVEESLRGKQRELEAKNLALQEAKRRVESYRDRYVDLYDQAPLGYVTLDGDGYIQEINLAGAALLGRSRAELTGCLFADHVAAADKSAFLEHVRECCHERRALTAEIDLLDHLGRTITAQIHSVPIDSEGIDDKFSKTAITDITERKRAEEAMRASESRYRSLFENMLDGFIYCQILFDDRWETRDILLLAVNAAFGRLTGLENVAGKKATEIIPEIKRTNPELFVNCGRVALTGRPETFEVDFTPLGKWFELSVYRQADRHVVVIFDDITERKHLHESLVRHALDAEAANKSKSQFLANISHELRTPMNAILGMIDVALLKANDATVVDCLQTARGSADLLLTLLDDLLDTAKIESGKLELEAAPFSLRRMLDQVAAILAVRTGEKGLRLLCRVADPTPDMVVGDRTRLQQVLLNLAGNAVKFTQHGEIEISLRALPSSSEAERTVNLEFAVRDTGAGIAPPHLERLFQPFVQADASMTRRFGGTGLGLAISKNLVELMGGRIWAESVPGRGSTFYFTARLPVTDQLAGDSRASAAVSTAAPSPLRILVVEDNPANQKLAVYFLQNRGHKVELAGDGQEAINLTRHNRYDVVLMDVQMPNMSGLDATITIRKRESGGRRVPIIATTAHATKSDRERCLAAGMDAYISKPIRREELIELVEQLGLSSGEGSSQP